MAFALPLARTWAALAACLAALAPAALAARQPADVRVETSLAGSDRALIPLTVTVRNRYLPTTGVIEVSFPDYGGRGEVRYVQPIDSPAPSLKTYTLWVRLEPNRSPEVTVVFRDHFQPFRQRLKLEPSRARLVRCLETPRDCRQGKATARYRFVEETPAGMPVDPLALCGWQAVMLSRHALETLTDPQREALARWVATGGTVIGTDLACGTLVNRLGLVSPGRLPTPGRPACLRIDAGLLAGSGEGPAANPAFWETSPTLMATLFPEADTPETSTGYASGHLGEICRNARSASGLNFLWMLLIVTAYGAAVGPLDRWIVKRSRRPHLTWVVFPAAILAFSLIAYGYSSLVNVGPMRVVTVGIVDAAPGNGIARHETLGWIYSARNATYAFESAVDQARLSARETSLGAAAVAGVEISGGRRATLAARIPVFSAKEFDASWFAPWPYAVSCRRTSAGLVVTVPEALQASAAYLAEPNGVTRLCGGGREWTTAGGDRLTWDMLLAKAADLPQRYLAPSRRGEAVGNTSRQRLQDYLLLLSCAGTGEWSPDSTSASGSQVWQIQNFLRGRDARELALDLRSRLERGPYLLLMTDRITASPLQPVDFAPEAQEVTLVRLPLPAADTAPAQRGD